MHSIAVIDDEEVVRRAVLRLCDCVVTDLHMPTMTGMQLLLQVRRMSSPPPVLVMSGSGTPEEREDGLASGAAAYLVKPVDHGVLLKAIAAAVEAPRQPS